MKLQLPTNKTRPFFERIVIYFSLLFIIVVFTGCSSVDTEDWTTYRHDSKRSGVTTKQVTPPLSLRWIFKPTHPPKPAWPMPAEELPRMHSDNAYHVSVVKGTVYFGSSVDNKVYALDAATGEMRWSFFTEGPIRFAPTICKGRIYFGSDDGYVYCLKAKTGKLVWKYRPGPSDEKVLGNGRMISLWPIRTSVLVDAGIVYFAAGVFPYEGLYICALNANDGSVVWKNDGVGDKAHELQFGGITPHGYLLATENILYVPSGRAMPAAFDRVTGQFLYYLSPGAKVGGTWALVTENEIIAGVDLSGTPAKVAYNAQTGERKGDAFATFDGLDLALTHDVAYTLTKDGIYAIKRTELQTVNQKLAGGEKQQQKLRGSLRDLNRKFLKADANIRGDIKNRLEETTALLNELIAEIDSLRNSICKWQYLNKNLSSIILAGNVVFAGGDGVVIGVDAQTGEELWKDEIDGQAIGLAAVNGNLFVSTDKGPIYCFSKGEKSQDKEVNTNINPQPYPKDKLTSIYESAAEEIIRQTGVSKGYCLVLDSGTGRLAFELVKRTELKIIGIEDDPQKVATAKFRLDAAGMYGSRVVVEQWDLSTLPDYFANLIVSDELVLSGEIKCSAEEMFRVLKPYGGVACFGQAVIETDAVTALEPENLLEWLKIANVPKPEVITENGVWIKLTRGELDGAGSWTHLYANPQNTSCSDDQLVKCPLGVLWYGDPGPERIVERHAKAAAPMAINGRLFVQGENVIMAYDSYNGTFLWKREIPGAVRVRVDVDGGNLALSNEGLFVAAGDKCFHLHPANGKTLHIYHLPRALDNKPRRWGYIACVGKTLFGSTAMPLKQEYNEIWKKIVRDDGTWKSKEELPPEYAVAYENYIESKYPFPDENARATFQRDGTKWHFITDFPDWSGGIRGQVPPTDRLMASDAVFAVEIETGKTKWVHRGKKIANIGISIGDGLLYFLESSITKTQREAGLSESRELVKKGIWEEAEQKVRPQDADVRLVVALDAATGAKRWKKVVDLTGCGGDAVASAYHDNVLLFFLSVGLHDKWRFPVGQLKWHRVTALSTHTRKVLWSRPLNYMVRPIIIDDTVIIEPRACDLYTGEIKTRSHPISGQKVPWEYYRPGHTCAVTSATENCLFYRSYNAAFYDLAADEGLTYFGAIRPGCWINLIPANGLLLFPEASSGCTCSFPLRCTVVLKSKKPEATGDWSIFITHGAITPVKHFAINLGAPGDRRDKNGNVWFGYPRPQADYGVKFDLEVKVLPSMGYFTSDIRSTKTENTDKPWLFSSGCLGLLECKVPLIDDSWGQAPGVYTVRLGFSAPTGDRPGKRIFDVKLQGDVVLENFDISKAAGGPNKAIVKEFSGIEVKNDLWIELVPQKPNSAIAQSPLLNFIKATKEDTRETAQAPKPVEPLTSGAVKELLRSAKSALNKGNHEKALSMYHKVFDAAATISFKRLALEGMAAIGSTQSLSRIAPFCKDFAPILWEYKGSAEELLNDAVQVHIAIANNIAETDQQMAAKMLRRSLSIAGGWDVRNLAAVSLDKLGIKIDEKAAKEGFVTRWFLVGPFQLNDRDKILDYEFVNEPLVDLSNSYKVGNTSLKWQKYVSERGMIDLVKLFDTERYAAIYAYTKVILSQDQDMLLKIGSDDGFKCWLNGEVVGQIDIGRGWEPDQNILAVKGKKGINTILLKISQWGGDWAFSARLTDRDNKPIKWEHEE